MVGAHRTSVAAARGRGAKASGYAGGDGSSGAAEESGAPVLALAADAEFACIMRRVEAALCGMPKSFRIRGEQWATKLGLMVMVPQEVFRRDRNLHAELLLQCIEEGCWREPFDRHPPNGPLPMLPPHVACAQRRRRLERLQHARAAGTAASGASRARPRSEGNLLGDPPLVSESSGAAEPWKEPPTAAKSPLDIFGPLPNTTTTAMPAAGNASFPAAVALLAGPQAGPAQPSASLAGAAAVAMGQCYGGVGAVCASTKACALLGARLAHVQDENRRLKRQLGQARCPFGTPEERPPKDSSAEPPGATVGVQNNWNCTEASESTTLTLGGTIVALSEPERSVASPTLGAALAPLSEPDVSIASAGVKPSQAGRAASRPLSPFTGRATSTPAPEAEVSSLSPLERQEDEELADPHDPDDDRSPPMPEAPLSPKQPSSESGRLSPPASFAPLSPGPPPADGDDEAFLRYLDEFQAYASGLCAAAVAADTEHHASSVAK
eukprot:gnl/TRDRNA2_/TRDRNA2_189363_c0_seq1.p1 gnl/TRDRNA2_/TRDRNA2_189363_c0~~gnl/TRDRNA2_/TRDRNA2_189363_c0_seq1.p1  ORF type:complete len:496 (-),score=86.34 gnl/TRDRNA2_/TRDRNA2_189363_c0_seq1:91-1578(-)